jgi:hypothetical protein
MLLQTPSPRGRTWKREQLRQNLQELSDLRVGVCKSGDGVAAQASVEFAGAVLNHAQDVHQHYAAFDRAIVAAEVEPR